MFCPECGQRNREEAKFCASCGNRMEYEEDIAPAASVAPVAAADETVVGDVSAVPAPPAPPTLADSDESVPVPPPPVEAAPAPQAPEMTQAAMVAQPPAQAPVQPTMQNGMPAQNGAAAFDPGSMPAGATMAVGPGGQTVIIQQQVKQSNGLGTAGFIFALLSLLFCWATGVNWVVWFLGALFSIIGVFRKPKGLAIAGLVMSFIDVILLIAVFGTLLAIFN